MHDFVGNPEQAVKAVEVGLVSHFSVRLQEFEVRWRLALYQTDSLYMSIHVCTERSRSVIGP